MGYCKKITWKIKSNTAWSFTHIHTRYLEAETRYGSQFTRFLPSRKPACLENLADHYRMSERSILPKMIRADAYSRLKTR